MNGSEKDDDASNNVNQLIISELYSYQVNLKVWELRKELIANCRGCFGCWFKTPGICVINDAGRDITRMLVDSDVVIFVSPIVFGGYSAELKKALDRMISYLNPDVMKVQGEVHHTLRYANRFRLIGIGISEDGNEENAEIFRNLIKRNSINFHCKSQASLVINSGQRPEEAALHIRSILEKSIGGEVING